MRSRLGVFALVWLGIFLAGMAAGSFLVDPENIGARLALYALAFVGLLGALIFGVAALVQRRRERR